MFYSRAIYTQQRITHFIQGRDLKRIATKQYVTTTHSNGSLPIFI